MKDKPLRSRIFHLGNGVIRAFFYPLVTISLFAALASANWVPDSGNTTGLTYLLFILLFALAVLPVLFPSFKKGLHLVFIEKRLLTSAILLGLALIWQLVFVFSTHPAFGFDVGAIYHGLHTPNDPTLRAYFSVNYNNVPLLIFLHKLVGAASWLTLDLVSAVATDITALAVIGSVVVLNKKQLPAVFYVTAAWIALFPAGMMPYTDVWGMLPVGLSVFFWSVFVKSKNGLCKVLAAWLAGACLAFGVWLKPSTAVWGIAAILAALLYAFKKKPLLTMLFCALFAAGFAESYIPLRQASARQSLIQVDKSRAIPAIHFVDVGLTHDGAYDPKAALMMDALPTKKQKVAYSKKQIKKRLHKRGVWGYLAFLVKKQGLNTADGTFGWLHEGHFLTEENPPNWLGEFIFPKGKYVIEFRICAQIFWTLALVILLCSWQNGGLVYQTLRLALVGTCLFLLIFEGGRSRYLIQTLPALLVLTALNTPTAFANLRRFKNALFAKKVS
jgi:integral membrane protein (TIGR03766 family)